MTRSSKEGTTGQKHNFFWCVPLPLNIHFLIGSKLIGSKVLVLICVKNCSSNDTITIFPYIENSVEEGTVPFVSSFQSCVISLKNIYLTLELIKK